MLRKLKFCKNCKLYFSKRNHFNVCENLKMNSNCEKLISALKNSIVVYNIKNSKYKNVELFLRKYCKKFFLDKTAELLKERYSFKFNVYFICHYKKIGDLYIQREFNFKTKNFIITKSVDLEETWFEIVDKLKREMVDFEVQGSGWTLSSIDSLQLRYSVYQPIKGSSYIPLPKQIKKTRSIINFKNRDDFCFIYAILSKHVKKIKSKKSFEPYMNMYNWDNLKWPMCVDNIKTFECQNPHTSVNVFFIEDDAYIKPYRLSKKTKHDHFDLLLLINQNKSHFTYIKNFERLIAPQLPMSIKKLKKKIRVCKKCILPFLTEKSLVLHKCLSKTITNFSINNTIPIKLKLSRSLFIFEYPNHSFKNCILYGSDKMSKTYDWTGLEEYSTIQQVVSFEKKNDISINLFGLDDRKKNIIIIKSCLLEKTVHFDLLLTTNDEGISYFSYIKDLNKFLFRFISKSKNRKYICKLCFSNFSNPEYLDSHKKDCILNPPVIAQMPVKGENILKFKNFQNEQHIPFVIYLDFECLLLKVDTCEPSPSKSFSVQFQNHKPYAFAYYIVSTDEKKNKFVSYTAESESDDVVQIFYDNIVRDVKEIDDYYQQVQPLNLTIDDYERFENTTKCEHCFCSFNEKNIKVRDHYHFDDGNKTGRLRKILCQTCNLNFQRAKFVPIFAHNLSGYDGHLLCKGLGYDDKPIHIVPSTSEKYISFSKRITNNISLRFVDTFRFMASSLDALVKTLPKNNLKHINKYFRKPKYVNLMMRKGVFCYDYLDDFEKLNETELPRIEDFYSKLYDQNITDDDYQHALNVWTCFKCKTLKDYSNLYLKSDVLLLTEVFESFRNLCLEIYELDPAWYYSIPGLALDAMLKKTNVEVELLTDISMYIFFERAIRGGISQCVHRYADCNNPYLGSKYDAEQANSYLTYVDANNLYGYAMCKKHPQKNFEWLSASEIHTIEKTIYDLNEDDDIGYFLEVDVEYPSHLHDMHNDLPFLCEKKKPMNSKSDKLLTTLEPKVRYVTHYLILQQALENGLILKKVHRGLKFFQSKWIEPYVILNSDLRRRTSCEFRKSFYKLMVNSVFGKLMEGVRNRLNCRLVTKWEQVRRIIAKPTFLDFTIFNENLVLMKIMQQKIKFNKSIFAGASILEQSKIKMYDFHYNVICKKFGFDKVKLLYMDTDSFFYKIETEDIYKSFRKIKKHLDTSDYPSDHFSGLHSNKNKKVVGKFKDELNGAILYKFVGLASKLYAYKLEDNSEHKKAKGVKTYITTHHINFENYIECLIEEKDMYRKMNNIVSKEHNIMTVTTNKRVLYFKDDKRFPLPNKIDTLAYGHYKIDKYMNSTS